MCIGDVPAADADANAAASGESGLWPSIAFDEIRGGEGLCFSSIGQMQGGRSFVLVVYQIIKSDDTLALGVSLPCVLSELCCVLLFSGCIASMARQNYAEVLTRDPFVIFSWKYGYID